MSIDTPLTIPPPPPGGAALSPPPELYSVADYVRYGMPGFAALMVRDRLAGPNSPMLPVYLDMAQDEHDNAQRAIVPREFHRDLRRVRKIKRLHSRHPHFFYRYAEQSGKHARPIKNWLYPAKIKTDPNDGSYYQPCGAVPLPAPQVAGLLPARAASTLRDKLSVPAGYFPQRITESLPLFATTAWHEVSGVDANALDLFERHYSSDARKREKWERYGFAGSGEKMVLMTWERDALFVWCKLNYRLDAQAGVECSVFRNESAFLSSDLITQAMYLARRRWGDGVRLFTFVDASKIRGSNPGYCFKVAGWQNAGVTAKGLHILERCAGEERHVNR